MNHNEEKTQRAHRLGWVVCCIVFSLYAMLLLFSAVVAELNCRDHPVNANFTHGEFHGVIIESGVAFSDGIFTCRVVAVDWSTKSFHALHLSFSELFGSKRNSGEVEIAEK